MKNAVPKFSTIVQAQADVITGSTDKEIKKKYGISKTSLKLKTAKINEIMASDLPETSLEKKIISEAISERLEPIKTELAVKSLEIIRKTDNEIINRLNKAPDLIKSGELINMSDIFSKRLSRLTGLDEDPDAGIDVEKNRNKNINVFVQNIIRNHDELLEKKRKNINNIYNVVDCDKDTVNKGENNSKKT